MHTTTAGLVQFHIHICNINPIQILLPFCQECCRGSTFCGVGPPARGPLNKGPHIPQQSTKGAACVVFFPWTPNTNKPDGSVLSTAHFILPLRAKSLICLTSKFTGPACMSVFVADKTTSLPVGGHSCISVGPCV